MEVKVIVVFGDGTQQELPTITECLPSEKDKICAYLENQLDWWAEGDREVGEH